MQPFQYIEQLEDLQAFCEGARHYGYIAIDTEFVRTRTYYARLGLVQARAGDQLVIIDPLAIEDLEPLWTLLKDPEMEIVIHAGGEDYEILQHHMQQIPTHVFDSQIAAAFAGLGDALGYAALVEAFTQVVLDKSQSRTDWMQRPLAQEQLVYAAADVHYLYDIYPQLKRKLTPEKLALVYEESALQVQKRAVRVPQQWLYLFFGNAWQCNSQQLGVLQELLIWRLQRAQASDIPVGFVAKDHTLLELARRLPNSLQQLRGITDLSPVTIRYAGTDLLQAIERGQSRETALPTLTRLTDMRGYKVVFAEIKKLVAEHAEALDINAALIASRRQINEAIQWYWQVPPQAQQELVKPDLLSGWRGVKLKAPIENLLTRDR